MGKPDALAHFVALKVQTGKIARIGFIGKTAIDGMRPGLHSGAQ